MVLEQVADHQDPPGPRRRRDRLLGVCTPRRQRLLHEAVLAGVQHRDRKLGVCGDGRGEHDRVELLVAEQVLERAGDPCAWERRPGLRARALLSVTQPCELAAGDRGEVAREVRAPVAEPGDADTDWRGGFAHDTRAGRGLICRIVSRPGRRDGDRARPLPSSWCNPIYQNQKARSLRSIHRMVTHGAERRE